tara:strand:- start:805 stop:1056 length:252 start_codon:yes stop_codon:yes gene_type:complete
MDLEEIFSPLSKEYCLWFYYLQIIGFIFLVIILLTSLFVIMGSDTKKKDKSKLLGGLFIMIMTYGIFYFQNRLFYSVCTKSLD